MTKRFGFLLFSVLSFSFGFAQSSFASCYVQLQDSYGRRYQMFEDRDYWNSSCRDALRACNQYKIQNYGSYSNFDCQVISDDNYRYGNQGGRVDPRVDPRNDPRYDPRYDPRNDPRYDPLEDVEIVMIHVTREEMDRSFIQLLPSSFNLHHNLVLW